MIKLQKQHIGIVFEINRQSVSDDEHEIFFYKNSLSICLLFIFLLCLLAQVYTGWKEYDKDMLDDNGPLVSFWGYLCTSHFYEATAENWESEFLQMGMYVILTIFLRQKGSSESKKIDEKRLWTGNR